MNLRGLVAGDVLQRCAYMVALPLLGILSGLLAWMGLKVGAFWGDLAAKIAAIATPWGWAMCFAKLFVVFGTLALLLPTEQSVEGLRLLREVLWFADAATFASLNMSRVLTRASLRTVATAAPTLQCSGVRAALQVAKGAAGPALFEPATLRGLERISKVVTRFFETKPVDLRLGYLTNSLRALSHLQALVGIEPRGVSTCLEDVNGGHDVKRFVGFAVGMHGHAGLKFLGAIPYGSVLSDDAAAAHCAGIPDEDIVFAEWEGRLHMPGIAVAIDRSTKSIVIAFRGTLWPQDVMTDLDCEPQDCELVGHCGVVHSGMFTAAERAGNILAPIVQRLLGVDRYHDFRLVITGHSLGAGVAALLTAIWLGPSSPVSAWASRLMCIGYGMPAIACPNFSSIPVLAERITAVVCGADVVPRFSLGSSMRLRNAVLNIWAKRSAAELAAIKDRVAAATQLHALLVADGNLATALCPLGRTIWIPPAGDRVTIVGDPGAAFRDLPLVGSMFEPHLPQNYAARISGL